MAALALISAGGCTTTKPEPFDTITGTYLSGRLAARLNDNETAARQFETVQSAFPANTELLDRAFYYNLLSGEIDDAIPLAQQVGSLNGSPEAENGGGIAHLTIAAGAIAKGDYARARQELARIEDRDLMRTPAYLLTGWAIAGDEGDQAGIEHFSNPPSDLFSGFNPLHLALLYERTGQIAEARTAYQLSFFGLGGPVGRRRFTEFLTFSDDLDAAREANRLMLNQRGPMRQLGLDNLAHLDAKTQKKRPRPVSPAEGAAIALFTFSTAITERIYDERQSAEEAGFTLNEPDLTTPLAIAQLALSLDPDLDEAKRYLGTIYNVDGLHDRAIAQLSGIPKSSPYYEQAQIEIAGAYRAKEMPEAAVDLLYSGLQAPGERFESALVLAGLLNSEHRYEDSVSVLSRVLPDMDVETYPEGWRFLISRADALIKIDRWGEAEADLTRAVEIAPEEPTALNYLGYSWAERGINLDDAFALLEKAVEMEPRAGAIIDSVGWAHYQLGNYDAALENLEKAVSLEPSDPTITDHLGDLYWQLGRKIEARYEWRRALTLEPDARLKATLDEKLKDGLHTDD